MDGPNNFLNLDELITVSPQKGSPSTDFPITITSSRQDSQPDLKIVNIGGHTNGPLGLGWQVPISSISRKIQDGLPTYNDFSEEDIFLLDGAELIPKTIKDGNEIKREILHRGDFDIYTYVLQKEGTFNRIHRRVNRLSGNTQWRITNAQNITSVYGHSELAKIVDPLNERRVFQWLLEKVYDDKGNLIKYEYKKENSQGVDISHPAESVRLKEALCYNNLYIKRVLYGNKVPYSSNTADLDTGQFSFEVVFDYGEHATDIPSYKEVRPWVKREDPFSTYVPGFELRTYRLCRHVLMFHRFTELHQKPTLVGATSFRYRENNIGTLLQGISYTGFQRDNSNTGYNQQAVPETTFSYSKPKIGELNELNLENVFGGVSGYDYRFYDLFGEGITGLLAEHENAWYYKRNKGDGQFGPLELVAEKPIPGQYQLADIDQNGNLNLAIYGSQISGFFELERNSEKWEKFVPFSKVPQIDFANPNVQLIDLNADGFPDIVISNDNEIIWYPSLQKEGFNTPIKLNKNIGKQGPPVIGENQLHGIYLSDMTGDGLKDIVQIQNGSIVFWPNLGFGNFGSLIKMDNPPWMDHLENYDSARIRLYDINSSGISDLIYLAPDGVKVWYNESGNSWSEEKILAQMPPVHDLASITIADLLGNGTACLVWSHLLPEEGKDSIKYIPLSDAVPAYLLSAVNNNMGLRVELEYHYSGKFYLQDKQNGKPWRSKIPSHFPVVSQKNVIDEIGGNTFSSRYIYHDGYYDGDERIFRGFGYVEQFDTKTFDQLSGFQRDDYVAPTCIKTWYHNGAIEIDRVANAQYYKLDDQAKSLNYSQVGDGSQLSSLEMLDAYRALSGQTIRKEIFGLDDTQLSIHPYTVEENNYKIQKIQGALDQHKASFMVIPCEKLSYTYERNPDDPRRIHELVLETDEFGNVLQNCQIAYPRRNHPERVPEQNTIISTLDTTQFAKPLRKDTKYRHSVPIEKRQMELHHLPNDSELFEISNLKSLVNGTLERIIDFNEDVNTLDEPLARLINWERFYYWDDDLSDKSDWGTFGALALLHHTETAVFDSTLPREVFGDRVDAQLLVDQHYKELEGYWWQSEPVQIYKDFDTNGLELPNPFKLILKYKDQASGTEKVEYDKSWLLPDRTTNALEGSIEISYDYHTLQPSIVTDVNGNITESYYDPLGSLKLTSQYGTQTDKIGQVVTVGDKPLDQWNKPIQDDIQRILQNPAEYLQNSSKFVSYDLFSWEREGVPTQMVSITRGKHVSDSESSNDPLLIEINYFDALGRVLQTKQKVEAGEVIIRNQNGTLQLDNQGNPKIGLSQNERWRVSGHITYNNKQLPIKQYEPFFSTLPGYENELQLQQFGETSTIFYDPLGREKRIETAGGFHSKKIYGVWQAQSFDENDTVKDSRYFKAFIETGLEQDSDILDAIEKSKQHSMTPSTVLLNALGQPFLQKEIDIEGNIISSHTRLNILGLPISVTDPRGIKAFSYKYDMKGRLLYQNSVDSGENWSLPDGLDRPALFWDGRGVHTLTAFDSLHRPTSVRIRENITGEFRITEILEYGESISDETVAKNKNLRGQLVTHFDQAGVLKYNRFNIKGQIQEKQRQLRKEYKEEADWNNTSTDLLESETFFSSYKYNAQNLLTEEQKADGSVHNYIYHLSGGLKQLRVTTSDGAVQDQNFLENIDYNAKGQVVNRLLGNEIATRYTYDRFNYRLSRVISRRKSDNRKWQDITYHYDPVGNITRVYDKGQVFGQELPAELQLQEYEYDAQYRLIRTSGFCHQALEANDNQRTGNPSGSWRKGTRHLSLNNLQLLKKYSRQYSYDLGGNLLKTKHQLDDGTGWSRSQLVSSESNKAVAMPNNGTPADPETFIKSKFDAVGNITQLQHLSEVAWNYRNNIAKAVIVPRTNAPDDAEFYTYGSDGKRVRKIFEKLQNGNQIIVTEKIYLDGCEILRIRRGSTIQKERITTHIPLGDQHMAHIFHWKQDTGTGSNNLTGQTRLHYQLNDHLGSSSIQFNEQGNLIAAEGYAPYGGSVWKAGDNLREVDTLDYRYSGKERDDHTGLYYYGFRYYASWLGRWTSTDPAGTTDGLNLYQFVRGNPIKNKDQYGLHTVPNEEDTYFSKIENVANPVIKGNNTPEDIGVGDYYLIDPESENFVIIDSAKDLYDFAQTNDLEIYKVIPDFSEVTKDAPENLDEALKEGAHNVYGNMDDAGELEPKNQQINDKEENQNISNLGKTIQKLENENKAMQEAMSKENNLVAFFGGIVSATHESVTGVLKIIDLGSDVAAGGISLVVLEPIGMATKEQTDQFTQRVDSKLDELSKTIATVSQNPIDTIDNLHGKAVDSTYKAMIGESSGFFDLSKAGTAIVLGGKNLNKNTKSITKGFGDKVELDVEGGQKGLLDASKQNAKTKASFEDNMELPRDRKSGRRDIKNLTNEEINDWIDNNLVLEKFQAGDSFELPGDKLHKVEQSYDTSLGKHVMIGKSDKVDEQTFRDLNNIKTSKNSGKPVDERYIWYQNKIDIRNVEQKGGEVRIVAPQNGRLNINSNKAKGFIESKVGNIDPPPRNRFEVRDHSPNKNAPYGSYSRDNFTTQVNTNKGDYLTIDDDFYPYNGIWKKLYDMNMRERSQAHRP